MQNVNPLTGNLNWFSQMCWASTVSWYLQNNEKRMPKFFSTFITIRSDEDSDFMEEMVQFRSPVRKPQSGEKKNRKVLSSDSENESTASNHGTIPKWCVFNAYPSCHSLCMVLSSNGGVGVCELAHFFFILFFCGIMLMYILFFLQVVMNGWKFLLKQKNLGFVSTCSCTYILCFCTIIITYPYYHRAFKCNCDTINDIETLWSRCLELFKRLECQQSTCMANQLWFATTLFQDLPEMNW